MEAAAATLAWPDELAAQPGTGDRHAFVNLYEPDFDGVFDLLLRTLRDQELAARSLRAGLERAWGVFLKYGAPLDVTGWLYGFARRAALECPGKRRAVDRQREGLNYTRVDTARLTDPSLGFDKKLLEIVWDAVVALDRYDYSLLDLHVRRDLSVSEIVEHVELSKDKTAGRLSELCDSVNDAVGSMLVATRARHICARLDAELSASRCNVAHAVRRHVRECPPCLETKERFVPATEVLGSFAFMTPPRGLREQTAAAFLAPTSRRCRKPR